MGLVIFVRPVQSAGGQTNVIASQMRIPINAQPAAQAQCATEPGKVWTIVQLVDFFSV